MISDTSLICDPVVVLYVGDKDMYDEACWPKKKKERERLRGSRNRNIYGEDEAITYLTRTRCWSARVSALAPTWLASDLKEVAEQKYIWIATKNKRQLKSSRRPFVSSTHYAILIKRLSKTLSLHQTFIDYRLDLTTHYASTLLSATCIPSSPAVDTQRLHAPSASFLTPSSTPMHLSDNFLYSALL